jgi:DNA modification methylase
MDNYAPSNEKDDEVPEEVRKTSIKIGDLFQLGEHRLLCGDATRPEDVAKLMDGAKADMIFTDPPYAVGLKYNKYDDNITKSEHAKFCKKWFDIIRQYSEFIVITPGFDNEYIFFEIDKKFNLVIWFKKFSISASRVAFARTCEPIFILGKPPIKRYDTDFFSFSTDRIKGLHKDHPCPKPVVLLLALIGPQTKKDGTVLDVFGGSGTTLIACEKLNRKCRMLEIDPLYCEVICERWENFTGKKRIKIT